MILQIDSDIVIKTKQTFCKLLSIEENYLSNVVVINNTNSEFPQTDYKNPLYVYLAVPSCPYSKEMTAYQLSHELFHSVTKCKNFQTLCGFIDEICAELVSYFVLDEMGSKFKFYKKVCTSQFENKIKTEKQCILYYTQYKEAIHKNNGVNNLEQTTYRIVSPISYLIYRTTHKDCLKNIFEWDELSFYNSNIPADFIKVWKAHLVKNNLGLTLVRKFENFIGKQEQQ